MSPITASFTQEITNLHADICSALADPTRILLLYALNERSKSVSELVQELGVSQPMVSRHLNILRERGLVSARREGQLVINSLTDLRVIQALDLLRAVLANNLKSSAELAENV